MSIEIASVPYQTQSIRPSSDRIRMHSPDEIGIHDVEDQGLARDQTVLVEARHLRKSYGNHLAVKDVSFSVGRGEVLGFLGPNGAGKSTSMFMLAGLLTPTSGEVLVNGQKFDRRNLDQRRTFGIVPQEYAIYEELSAIANLMFFGRLYGLRRSRLKDRCDEVLTQIGLTESARRLAGQFSGGMKRRLNFGIAMMHEPEILILDEPTLGVDPQSRFHLMDCIRRQTAGGGSVIYASHYMEEVQSICQRAVILDHGQVIANDSINNLLSGLSADLFLHVDHTTGITDELTGVARLATGSHQEPIVVVSGNAQPVHDHFGRTPVRSDWDAFATDNVPEVRDLAWRLRSTLYRLQKLGIRVLSVETQQSNLEGLFLQLTGKRLRD